MPAFLPPETSDIIPRVVSRNARRAHRVFKALAPTAAGWRSEALRALEAVLASLRGPRRAELLFGPDLRAWLSLAEQALLLTDPRTGDVALFDRIARGPHLAEIVPSGRVDRGFRQRAVALGRRLRESAFIRLPPLLAFLTPPHDRFGPFPLDLAADGEEARVEGELHLRDPVPAALKLEPQARLELAWGGVRVIQRGPAPLWEPRETIGESGLVLARQVISTRRGPRPGRSVSALSQRLGRALDLIGAAWQQGHREVMMHTRVVVPLVDRGTVSYSLPDRPGVSYINVQSKSVVDLADDLIHEAAHHRLHSLEEVTCLERDDDLFYWSPWRRSPRPLRGILHATYTFTWRAALLSRLLALSRRLPRAWIERELAFEVGALTRSLADLADAERRGLLTPAGARLRRAMAARVYEMG